MVKTRQWTKWGGGRLMLVKENPDIWYCQACAEKQTKDCPAYMFPIGDNNYIRICSECENKVVRIRIVEFKQLKTLLFKGMMIDII